MIKVLVYEKLDPRDLGEKIQKAINSLTAGDFKSPDVQKINAISGYYRLKLDQANRLLLQISRTGDTTFIYIIEVIHNHAYNRSKFLNGTRVDSDKFTALNGPEDIEEEDLVQVPFVHPEKKHIYILDKIISLDDVQEQILRLPAPCIIIGSAGSGKTAITLEKLKQLKGNILYTTLSSSLADNAGTLYSFYGFKNEEQKVSFLSFYEYQAGISIPKGKEVDFTRFDLWISSYKQAYKIKDTYKIYEEIKGVITGSTVNSAYLTLEEYQALGIKKSIFPPAERPAIYELFTKYLNWLATADYFDSNITSFELLNKITPGYDYVVVDEVQDLTMIQLSLILKSLKQPSQFVICGDANQIVHPNFFSWSQIKALFYEQNFTDNITGILATNYRNSPEVTTVANNLLQIKIARFGSIDRESNHLTFTNSNQHGTVEFLENNQKTNIELNSKTSNSAKFSIIVLRDEDKAAARKYYSTPLIFSIHEVKGLEYENIILFNIISTYENEYKEITNGVTKDDLFTENPKFSRAKDKTDKSLEEYKFYINALYVAITRAIKSLYVVETNKKHPLLNLLGLTSFKESSALTNQISSKAEWHKEALKLEKQGKTEQLDHIREQILHLEPVPWAVTTRKDIPELKKQALNPDLYNKKFKDRFFQHAIFNNLYYYISELADLKYRPARLMSENGFVEINSGQATLYYKNDLKTLITKWFSKHGVNFRNEINFTPLMTAIMFEQPDIINYLLENGAKADLQNNLGKNALHVLLSHVHKFNFELPIKTLFIRFYDRLKPDHIKVKINDQLIKIGSHESEFLILNFMIANLFDRLEVGTRLQDPDKAIAGVDVKTGFQTSDFIKLFEGLPEQVMPEYQHKSEYINSILSRNELNAKSAGNKKLFVRLKQGLYVPHPLMEILIEEEWVNIYDDIDIDSIIKNNSEEHLHYITLLNNFRKQLNQDPNAVLMQASYWEDLNSEG